MQVKQINLLLVEDNSDEVTLIKEKLLSVKNASFNVFSVGRLDQAGRTLSLMKEIIAKYREDGPTEEEFANAKQAFVNSYVWDYESSDNILYRLTYLKWQGLPLDTPQQDLEAYQKLTIEDVRKAASELLHPDSLIVVVVGNKDKLDRPLEDFGVVFELKKK